MATDFDLYDPDDDDNPETDADGLDSHDVDEDLSLEDIEAAYLKALETAEFADAIFSQADPDDDAKAVEATENELESDDVSTSVAVEVAPSNVSPISSEVAHDDQLQTVDAEQRLTPIQVIEGLLFVGGKPLPAKKMSDVLGGTLSHEQVDEFIAELNQRYRSQNRPYEIRLVEGGYEMTLLYAYEAVRSRVYGHGPKEVKLSQEVLEILAFVAYQQPVTKEEIDETGKKGISGILRQLLRRQLVHLERGETDTYQTTTRFLQLFGLADIADLPQARDFNFK